MPSQPSPFLAERTWPEIEAAIENGTRTVVVAVGAIEQHGPHLPLNVDALRGDELARRIADRLGDALVAPTIRPGCSGHHVAFPGTVSVRPETLMDLLRDYCESLDAHGFEHLVLMPTHGGNFGPVQTVAPEIARDVDANVVALTDLDRLMALQREGLAAGGVDYEQSVVHAGAVETAVLLAVAEDLVRVEELELGCEDDVSAARLLNAGFEAVTENGAFGDPPGGHRRGRRGHPGHRRGRLRRTRRGRTRRPRRMRRDRRLTPQKPKPRWSSGTGSGLLGASAGTSGSL